MRQKALKLFHEVSHAHSKRKHTRGREIAGRDWKVSMKSMRLVKKDEDPTRQEVFMAGVEQSWREWNGPSGRPWIPYQGSTAQWSESVSKALDRGRYIVITDTPVPLWRRTLKKLRLMQ